MGSGKWLVWLVRDQEGKRLKAWSSIFKAENSWIEEWDKYIEVHGRYVHTK